MELKAIRPLMRGMEPVEGMAQIVIEATQEEATKIGSLLFMPVSIEEDETYRELDVVMEFIGCELVEADGEKIRFSEVVQAASAWLDNYYAYRPAVRVLAGMLKERLETVRSGVVWVQGYRFKSILEG